MLVDAVCSQTRCLLPALGGALVRLVCVCGYLSLSPWEELLWSGSGPFQSCLYPARLTTSLWNNSSQWPIGGTGLQETWGQSHARQDRVNGVNNLGGWCCYLAGSHSIYVSRLMGWVGGWVGGVPFFLEKAPKHLCPSSTYSEISEQISFQYTPGIFQSAVPMLYLHGVICSAVSLKADTTFPLAFSAVPELSLLIFKVPGSKFHGL